jgi:hypothetical protein
MRTTVTLDPDADAAVRRLMRERGMTFKQALNEAIRRGTGPQRDALPFRTTAHAMGEPVLPIEKALRLAAQLEDEEIVRKLAQRK